MLFSIFEPVNDSFQEPPLEQPELPDLLSHYREGRDEMNIVEFPISSIGTRHDPSVKTISFEDQSFDKASGQVIARKLIITASDELGLPAAADDEVLLGLLQLSRLQGFESPTLYFTPYQLLQILGWPVNTNNYRRLRESINRWLGVTLRYENAWRDRQSGEWIDAGFHFIEYVEFYKPGQQGGLTQDGNSVIKWNDLVFRNFREGNLKALDFHLYRSLQSSIAKRLYRFLDKRFYHRRNLTFDLEVFACEKIGLTRPVKMSRTGKVTTDVGQIKRRLMGGINELEKAGFIQRLDEKSRFTKMNGRWQVHFERAAAQEEGVEEAEEISVEDLSPLEGRMVGHGVSRAQVKRLFATYGAERIERQLDALEFLLTSAGGKNAPENRAGWLCAAITEDYAAPRGFKSKAEREREARERAERARQREEAKRQKRAQKMAANEADRIAWEKEAKAVEEYLRKLTPAEREALEAEALRKAGFGSGRASAMLRAAFLHNHVVDLLKASGQLKKG